MATPPIMSKIKSQMAETKAEMAKAFRESAERTSQSINDRAAHRAMYQKPTRDDSIELNKIRRNIVRRLRSVHLNGRLVDFNGVVHQDEMDRLNLFGHHIYAAHDIVITLIGMLPPEKVQSIKNDRAQLPALLGTYTAQFAEKNRVAFLEVEFVGPQMTTSLAVEMVNASLDGKNYTKENLVSVHDSLPREVWLSVWNIIMFAARAMK